MRFRSHRLVLRPREGHEIHPSPRPFWHHALSSQPNLESCNRPSHTSKRRNVTINARA